MIESEEHISYVGTIVLSTTPRTIYELWNEWTVGIGGRKPARNFSSQERSRVKHKYAKRKLVWDTVKRLVNRGLSVHVVIDEIYAAYGRNNSLTKIITLIQRDKTNFVPPELRI